MARLGDASTKAVVEFGYDRIPILWTAKRLVPWSMSLTLEDVAVLRSVLLFLFKLADNDLRYR